MPIDYSKYPPNWLSEIRPRILERAGHRCEKCGVFNYLKGYRMDDGSFIEAIKFESSLPWAIDLFGTLSRVFPPGVELITIILTIAHLDRDSENWSVADERLMALCQRCHLNYDRPINLKSYRYGREYLKDQLVINF